MGQRRLSMRVVVIVCRTGKGCIKIQGLVLQYSGAGLQGGEYMFVDYAGQSMSYTDPLTGEVKKVQVFVTALGASSYTYVEAQTGQDKRLYLPG